MWWIIKALRALGDTWPLGLVLGSLDIWAQDWHVGGGRGGGVVVAIGACFLADYLQRRAEERAVEARAEEHLERVRTVLREVKQRARELDPTALDDPDVQCDVAR